MSHQLPIAERIRCSTRVLALLKQSHTVIRSRWMDEQLSGYKMCLDEYPQLYWKVLFYLFRPDLERQIEPQVTESALLYFMVEFGWVPLLYHTGIKDKDQLNARLEHYWQCYIDDAASNQPVSREELADVPREFPYRFAQTLNFPYQFYNLSHVSFLGWFTRSSINTTSLAMTQNLVSLFERFRDCAQKGEDILTTNYVVHVRFAYILSVSTLFRIAAQNVEQQCEELQETVCENRDEMIVYFSDSDNGPKIRKYLNKEMFRYFVQDKTFRELCQKSLFPQKEKVKEEKKEAALPNEEEIVIMPEKYCDWLFGERKVYDCVEWGKPFVTVKVFNRLCSKYDKKKVNSPPQLGPDDDPFDPEETFDQAEPVEEQALPVNKKSDLVEWMPDAYQKYLRSIAILPSRANWTCSQLMVMFNDSMREFVLNEVTKESHSARTKLRDQIIWLVVVGRIAHKKAQDFLKNPTDDNSDSSEDSDSDGDDQDAASDDDTTPAQSNLNKRGNTTETPKHYPQPRKNYNNIRTHSGARSNQYGGFSGYPGHAPSGSFRLPPSPPPQYYQPYGGQSPFTSNQNCDSQPFTVKMVNQYKTMVPLIPEPSASPTAWGKFQMKQPQQKHVVKGQPGLEQHDFPVKDNFVQNMSKTRVFEHSLCASSSKTSSCTNPELKLSLPDDMQTYSKQKRALPLVKSTEAHVQRSTVKTSSSALNLKQQSVIQAAGKMNNLLSEILSKFSNEEYRRPILICMKQLDKSASSVLQSEIYPTQMFQSLIVWLNEFVGIFNAFHDVELLRDVHYKLVSNRPMETVANAKKLFNQILKARDSTMKEFTQDFIENLKDLSVVKKSIDKLKTYVLKYQILAKA